MYCRGVMACFVAVVGLLLATAAAGQQAARTDTTRARSPQPASGGVRGLVVDATTRQPLADVVVQVDREERSIRTSADGRFELTDLAPGTHGLYVSIIGYVLVKRDVVVRAGQMVEIVLPLAEGAAAYHEEVRVAAPDSPAAAPLVAARQMLGSADLQNLRGVLTDDPMRAVQALPGVTANDDLRAELAVRGSDFAHIGILVDGVESHALMHAVRGTQDGGSIAMINSDVLESVSLLAGSYPQRYGNRTGAEIGFTMREGSRDRTRMRGSVSGTNAATVLEGPIGHARKGSWLFSARKSYLDFIVNAVTGRSDFDLGFIDAQSKVAYDLTPAQRIVATVVFGRSHLHDNPATAVSSTIVDGKANAGIGAIAWIATPSPRLAITQRVSAEASRFKNDNRTGLELEENDRDSYSYRVDVLHSPSTHVTYEAGLQAQHHVENARVRRPNAGGFTIRNAYDASNNIVSAFARATTGIGRRWSIESGARVDHGSISDETVGSPWVGVSWVAPRGLVLSGGSGLYHQFPTFDEIAGARGAGDLRAERATHVDVGIEQRIGRELSWLVVAFARNERNFIRLPNAEPRLVAGRVRFDSQTTRFENRLDGRSHGVELTVRRNSRAGLSGWVSYAYAKTSQHDRVAGEPFRADFDQRHTFNAYAHARLSSRLSVAAKVRAGSGTPVIGYFEQRGADVFLSERRNGLELPPYLRVDARANRVFNMKRSRVTVFAEVLNVFNRENQRQSGASINRTTGLVTGIFDTMAPIVPSMGVLVEF